MTARSEQLEREAEETRADLQSAVDELRYRITPGQILDQALDFAREGQAGELVGNLRDQVVRRPLPLLLIGAGIAWLMLPSRGKSAAGSPRAAAEPVSRHAGDGIESPAGDSPGTDAGLVDRITRFCREQPLIVAGAGLAAGALVGAVVARTAIADRRSDGADETSADEVVDAAAEQLAAAAAAEAAARTGTPATADVLPQVSESLGIVPDHKASGPAGGPVGGGPVGPAPEGSPDGHG